MFAIKLEEFLETKTYTRGPGKKFKSFHGTIRNEQTDLCTKGLIIVFCIIAKSLETI